MRKELEQMKAAWEEKENVCVLLEKIHHKLDILSELEGLFRGKRFVEYISRYYLEHIAREAIKVSPPDRVEAGRDAPPFL